MAQRLFKGTLATKEFYDRIGWRRQRGVLVDTALFSASEAGPIQQSLLDQRAARVGDLVGGPGLRLVECGCGGTPAVFLAGRCESYTAVDFSVTGLSEAAAALTASGVAFKTVEADITDLPFADGEFDVAYSAHALYHIDRADGQAAAFREILRVVGPGGRAVFVRANPFPLLFPWRLIRRVLAMTPLVNSVLQRARKQPPLPYLPMPLGWMRRQLEPWGEVRIAGFAIPSVWFEREVSERSTLGRWAWRVVRWLETAHPGASARLGCFVTILVIRQRP